jgi:hypothetical protein
MTGKAYYLTTFGDWQRHAARFANSHFIVLHEDSVGTGSKPALTTDALVADRRAKILVLIEADEGVHLSLEDEPAFELLPHPLAQKPISDAAQAALAPHGVAPGATTFDAAEAVARLHPLLRHRVF